MVFLQTPCIKYEITNKIPTYIKYILCNLMFIFEYFINFCEQLGFKYRIFIEIYVLLIIFLSFIKKLRAVKAHVVV